MGGDVCVFKDLNPVYSNVAYNGADTGIIEVVSSKRAELRLLIPLSELHITNKIGKYSLKLTVEIHANDELISYSNWYSFIYENK